MSLSLLILVILILFAAACWIFAESTRFKFLLFPFIQVLLFLLFWKIAGGVFAHLFLFTGIVITLIPLIIIPENDIVKNIPFKWKYAPIISLGVLAIYLITALLVFINAARFSEFHKFSAITAALNPAESAGIYLLILTLFALQFYKLLKGISGNDE